MLNINLAGLGLPLQCLGLHSYAGQLALTLLAPLLLAALFVLVCILRHCRCSGVSVSGHCACSGGGRLLGGLPWLLGLSFLVLPDGLLTLTPNPNPNPNR